MNWLFSILKLKSTKILPVIEVGGELYVLAKHRKMCKLANWSRPSNITSCSRASDRVTEEQAKQPNIHMREASST
jgi:hypothetical protein